MSNGGIIGPVNDPTRGDVTTTFTASGTYTSPGFGPLQADYLVVAGGGGGGRDVGGGGGAGGYRASSCGPAPLNSGTKLTIPASPITVTVGAGGTGAPGGPCGGAGGNGSNSVFANSPSPITSTGGGGGGGYGCVQSGANSGGSGGGSYGYNQPGSGGAGNTPPVNPPQGFAGGGNPGASCLFSGGGGGGAGGVGTTGAPFPGQNGTVPGGPGVPNLLSGASITYAAGGKGFADDTPGGSAGGNNSGNGGDGGGLNPSPVPPTGANAGWNGGSGIVIVKQTAAGPFSIASGVWSLQEQYNLKKNNQWTS